MRSMFRKAFVAMLAVLALGAVMASAAQAVEAVHFKVAGKKLGEGQSKEITSQAGKVSLGLGKGISSCSTAVAPGGKIFGSSAGNPGTGELELEFTNCKGGEREKCTFSGSAKTTPLKLVLGAVEKTEFTENHGELAALLKPKSGVKVITLHSPACGEVSISGELAVKIGSGDKVNEETPEAKTLELTMPYPYNNFVLVEGGLARTFPYGGLRGQLEPIAEEGSVKLELASGENWGVFQKH